MKLKIEAMARHGDVDAIFAGASPGNGFGRALAVLDEALGTEERFRADQAKLGRLPVKARSTALDKLRQTALAGLDRLDVGPLTSAKLDLGRSAETVDLVRLRQAVKVAELALADARAAVAGRPEPGLVWH